MGALGLLQRRAGAVLIRAEPTRVLHIELRLHGSGKYELASLELHPDTPLERETCIKKKVATMWLSRFEAPIRFEVTLRSTTFWLMFLSHRTMLKRPLY